MVIRLNKNGQWYVSFTLPDKNRKRVTFPKGTLKRDAISFVNENMKLDKASISVNMKKNFDNLKFAEIANLYIGYLSKTDASDNVSYVNKTIEYWKDCKISDITPALLSDWIESLFVDEKNYAVATVEKYLAYFKTVFNYAVKKEIITHNPVSKVEFTKEFKKKTKRNFVISRDEFKNLNSLFSTSKPQIKDVLTALWHSGMRINEVLNLKWHSVQMGRGVIILNPSEVKEKKTRYIVLEKEFIEVLNRLRLGNNGEYVFCFNGVYKISYQVWRSRWLKNTKSTDFGSMTTHDLRHCWATIRYQEGWTKEEIKLQLGHTTESMFVTYNTTGIQDLQKAAGFLSEKRDVIDDDVRALMKKVKDRDVPIGTLQASIRDFR